MMKRGLIVLVLLMTLGAVMAPSQHHAVAASKRQVSMTRRVLDQVHYKGAVLITSNGAKGAKTLYFGDADHAKHRRNNAQTVYLTASLQKVITGGLIEQQIAKHRLSMSTKLSRFFPQVPYANQITIRRLLDHTSGIQMPEITPSKVLTESQAVNFAIRHAHSTGRFQWHYSNGNFILLAGVLRKVTHQSYASLLKHQVITKLKLKHTFDWNRLPKNVAAVGYTPTYQRRGLTKKRVSSFLGCGNLYTTPADYYAIQRGLQNGKILSRSRWQQLRNHRRDYYNGGMYNLVGDRKQARGKAGGFDTFILASEGNHRAVILFSNQSLTTPPMNLADTIYNQL